MDIVGYECFTKKSCTKYPDFAILRNENSTDVIGIVEILSAKNITEDFLKAKGMMLAAMLTQRTKFGFAAAMEGKSASLARFSRSDENETILTANTMHYKWGSATNTHFDVAMCLKFFNDMAKVLKKGEGVI